MASWAVAAGRHVNGLWALVRRPYGLTTVGSQMSGIMNFALGVRVSPKTIANVNVGFGVTELSPDIILGLSLPIDIEGVKPAEGN